MNISADYSSALSSLRSSASEANSATNARQATKAQSGSSYAEQLKGKFPDLNLTAGDYRGGTTGSGVQGNVMISPKYLEKAANNPKLATELEKNLGCVTEGEEWLKNQCEAKGMHLDACGTIIDENGDISSWAQTSTSSGSEEADEAEEKRLEKQREKKAEEEKRATEKQEAAHLQSTQMNSVYLTQYAGAYETPLSTTLLPYSLNCYA